MENKLAIKTLEETFATMIYGVTPVIADGADLEESMIYMAAEQLRNIVERDSDYTLKDMVVACKELSHFFGQYEQGV